MLSRAPSSSFNGPSSSQSHLLAMGLLPFFFVVPLGGKEKRVRTGNKKFQPWFVASFRLTRERGRGWRPTQVKEANTDDESRVLFFLNLARSTVFFFLSFFLFARVACRSRAISGDEAVATASGRQMPANSSGHYWKRGRTDWRMNWTVCRVVANEHPTSFDDDVEWPVTQLE